MELPVIPLRQSVLFPGSIMPISVGRAKTVAAVKRVQDTGDLIALITQKVSTVDDPKAEDLFTYGTTGRILKILRSSEDGLQLVIQGVKRFRVLDIIDNPTELRARIAEIEEVSSDGMKSQALMVNVKKTAREVVQLIPQIPANAAPIIEAIEEPSQLADTIAASL